MNSRVNASRQLHLLNRKLESHERYEVAESSQLRAQHLSDQTARLWQLATLHDKHVDVSKSFKQP